MRATGHPLDFLWSKEDGEFQAETRHFFEFVSERVMRTAFRERDRSVAIGSAIEEHSSMHTNIDIMR